MDPAEISRLERIIGIINTLLHSVNLIFILHNIYKYVIGLRMKHQLIWMFYTLVLLGTIFRISEFTFSTIYPEDKTRIEADILNIFVTAGLSISIYVELTLILTIHRLTLALKFLLGETSERSFNKQ